VLETAAKGCSASSITIPLFKEHKILTQVSGHGSHTIKLLPSLTITDEDCSWIESAFDTVDQWHAHRVPGAVWSLARRCRQRDAQVGLSHISSHQSA